MNLPKFMPKTIQKIIDKNKPTYYDKTGNIIAKADSNLEVLPEFQLTADTTATIPLTVKEPVKEPVQPIPANKVVIGYCVHCKVKQVMKDVTITDMRTSRGIKRMAKGSCTVCSTKMGAILPKIQ